MATSRARTSSSARDPPGDRVCRSGCDLDAADRADGVRARPGLLGHGQDERAAATSASRRPAMAPSPRGWTRRRRPPATAAAGRARRRPRAPGRGRRAPCPARRAPRDTDSTRASCPRLAISDSRVTPWIASAPPIAASAGVDVELARDRQAREAGGAEARALLVDERDHGQRPAPLDPRLQHRGHRLERADDAERAVVGAAVGLRVEVRAGARPRPVAGIRRHRPHAARAVAAHLEADRPRPSAGTTPAPRPRAASTRPGSSRCRCGRSSASSANQSRNRSRETAGIGSGRIRG